MKNNNNSFFQNIIHSIRTRWRIEAELFLIVICLIIVFFISSKNDFFEFFYEFTKNYKSHELCEMVTVIIALSLLFTIFAFRRWKDIRQENAKLNLAEYQLNFHIEFQKLITKISTRFINIKLKKLDKEINLVLQEIAEFADVDRSYIFLFNDDKTEMSNIYEWCKEGIEPQIDNLKDLSVDIFPWWMKKLKRFENVYIPFVEMLPKEAEAEKEILSSQNIKSLIVIPLIYSQDLIGYMGFDSVEKEIIWSENIISLLHVVGDVFVNTLEHKLMTEELQRSEEKYRTMIDNANDIIWMIDRNGNFVYANSQAESITGYKLKQWKNKSFVPFIHHEDLNKVNDVFQKILSGKSLRFSVRIYDKNKKLIYLSINTAPLYENGVVVGTINFGRDITYRKMAEKIMEKANKKLQMLARTDSLTKLATRRSILEKIEYEIKKFERSKEPFVIIIGDLDNFKQINDEYGHSAGDMILKSVSKIMTSLVRKQDVVSRWGGDEFLLFLPQTELMGGVTIIKKVKEKIENMQIEFHEHNISTSITFGLSVFDKLMDINHCIKVADMDLYKEKKNKK